MCMVSSTGFRLGIFVVASFKRGPCYFLFYLFVLKAHFSLLLYYFLSGMVNKVVANKLSLLI